MVPTIISNALIMVCGNKFVLFCLMIITLFYQVFRSRKKVFAAFVQRPKKCAVVTLTLIIILVYFLHFYFVQ
jgi:ABC-type sulfate transport system permease subunit